MRNDSGLQPEEPPSRRRLALVAAIAFFVVAANALGYVVYRGQRRDAVEVGSAPATAPPPAPTAPAPSASPSEDPVKQLAREQRDRGIQALRNGTYGEARAALEAAAKLDPTLTEVTTLLELVEKLSSKTAEPERTPERAAERGSDRAADRASERAPERASERTPDRADRANTRAARAAEAPSAPGVLLVTTTPPRLLVKIDGQGVELSPARLELTPGRHLVEIVQGGRVVLERSIELASGQSAVISETFAEPQADARAVVAAPVAPPPRVSPAPSARASGLEDERLDLVGLVDRPATDRAATDRAAAKAPVTSPSPAAAAAAVAPPGGPARTASPSLFVVGGAGLEATLEANMRGVDVQVFGSSSELRAAMAREAPDGVLGPSAVVKGLGLQPAVLGVGPKVSWVAATLKAGLTRAELAGLTVGVVEDASKKVVEDRVGELVGGKPRVRRVPKTDDLLPLLQLKMADAVVVREADLAELRARTQQTVHVVPLGGVDSTRALAFTEGSRRSVVERAVLGLGADVRAQLGVEKWSKE